VDELGWRAREFALRLRTGVRRRLDAEAALLARLDAHLGHLNPQSVLERGYSITETAAGRIVRDGSQLAVGENVTITFAKGRVGAQVNRKG
jgi:exodeoxyribonuclease VII large subunit